MVACALVAILAETWFVAGLFRPVRVAGGSMATALRGPHRLWACARCGAPFACGHESLPAPGRAAVCPYCQAKHEPDDALDVAGQRVLVDRAAFAWRSPRRWEAVALRCPEAPSELCVKRVVGLPGERVEIRGGDVWVDGQVARKSLSDARGMAVLVYAEKIGLGPLSGDSTKTAGRWLDASGAWRREKDGIAHRVDVHAETTESSEHAHGPIHWLEYHHPERPPSIGRPPAELADGPILDESPYDQAESRLLNPVADVLVRAQMSCGSGGEILLRGSHRGDTLLARFDVDSGNAALERNGRVVASIRAAQVPRDGPFELDWMLADAQVRLAVDGRLLVQYAWQPAGDAQTGPPNLAIGAHGAGLTITRLDVWRDVYYTPGSTTGGPAELELGSDEYYLLGDNSPHSQDSRSWQPAGIPGHAIVGRVVRW